MYVYIYIILSIKLSMQRESRIKTLLSKKRLTAVQRQSHVSEGVTTPDRNGLDDHYPSSSQGVDCEPKFCHRSSRLQGV